MTCPRPRTERRWLTIVIFLALSRAIAGRAAAQTSDSVLVVVNSNSPASVEIGEYYARKRQIPADQVLRLNLAIAEEIERAAYEAHIERPLAAWLGKNGAQDRILYLVLTKGVPLRIAGSVGLSGTVASVDSELTLLYRKLYGGPTAATGSIKNPYFLGDSPLSDAKPFSHQDQDIYLVARLDGFTVPDVKALIDRGTVPSREGVILLDGKSEWTKSPGNTWLERAATILKGMPGWADRVVIDTSPKVLREQSNVLGYYSWGSNDPAIILRHLHLQFVPGALAAMFVSSDGRTFQEPPADWQLRTEFAGSDQSLAGDLIRDGITGIAGHVAEPYLSATIRPDVLFPAYVSGFNLVESFYLAMPALSWQTVVVGDPLCAPFRVRFLTRNQIDAGVDPSTELPMFFSRRNLQTAAARSGYKAEAMALLIKATARNAKGNLMGARQALEESLKVDDRFVPGYAALAQLFTLSGDYDHALEYYRSTVRLDPQQPVALNNFAYLLAVHKGQPQEALASAEKAYALSGKNPAYADTLGWIQHLLGHDHEAAPLLEAAVRDLPMNADLLLHTAIVHAALGQSALAEQELKRAAEIDARIGERPEAKALATQLRKRPPPADVPFDNPDADESRAPRCLLFYVHGSSSVS